jgi:D-threo-aldose 1-dehydrogenase
VFNSGILAAPQAGATFDYREADPELIARAQRLDAICRAHGADLKAAAIQFALAHRAVSGVVLGARTAGEIEQNASVANQTVPAVVWQQIRQEALVDAKAPLPGDPA